MLVRVDNTIKKPGPVFQAITKVAHEVSRERRAACAPSTNFDPRLERARSRSETRADPRLDRRETRADPRLGETRNARARRGRSATVMDTAERNETPLNQREHRLGATRRGRLFCKPASAQRRDGLRRRSARRRSTAPRAASPPL